MSIIPDGRAKVIRRSDQRSTRSDTTELRFVTSHSQVEYDFGLFEYQLAARSAGASPHYHRTFSESFYVLEGELEVLDAEVWVTAGPGDLVYVPRSSVHGFRNSQDEPVTFLVLFSPGVILREEYFEAVRVRQSQGTDLSEEQADAFARRYDQYNVH